MRALILAGIFELRRFKARCAFKVVIDQADMGEFRTGEVTVPERGPGDHGIVELRPAQAGVLKPGARQVRA